MPTTNRARCYNPRWGTKQIPTKTNRAANRCRSLYVATHRNRKQVGGAAGRTRGVPRTARASTKPAQVRDGAEDRERTRRERSSESVRQHLVLSARDNFLFFALPFYSPSRGRLALTAYQPNLPASILACTYFRPYMLLGARACEEPVHTPGFSDSSCGRFSSRQRA